WLVTLSPIGKFVAGAATFLTLVLAYYSFTPKLSVSSNFGSPDPFDAPFVLKNDSLFQLHSIEFVYDINKVIFDPGIVFEKSIIRHGQRPIKDLDPGESTSVN